MSRIDRVLISEEWSQAWGEILFGCYLGMSQIIVLWLFKNGGWDWGPNPFRFNNFWLQNQKFKGVVEEA